ncbi:membrane-associating domain-containing protein [Trichoderma evansii]
MSKLISVMLRSIALVFTLIITGLIGNVIASNRNGHMVTINFTIFVCAWSWVALLYGMFATFIESLAVALVLIFFDGFATLLTFICAIVLAAKIRAPNCGNIPNQHLPASWIGFGDFPHDEKRCREIQASTAFMWFLWVCFTVILIFNFMDARTGGFGGSTFSRSSRSTRSTRPSMSQV